VIRLLSSEFLRARSRDVVKMLFVAAALGTIVAMSIASWNSKPAQPLSGRAQQSYEKSLQQCLDGRFLGPKQELPPGFDSLEEYCANQVRPEYYGGGSSQMRLADLGDILEGLSSLVVLIGVVLGASLGGADWSVRTMATLLTWEPRRARVLLVRAFVVLVTAFCLALATQSFFVVVFRAAVALRGTTEGLPSHFVKDVVEVVLRTSAVAALLSLVALAVATIGRSTAAGIGILFGYLVLVEGFLANLVHWLPRWTLARTAASVISQQPVMAPTERFGMKEVLTPSGALVVVVGYAVVTLALALAALRVRDVD
jgi:hypothetical protein